MKTLILVDSQYGFTKRVAQAIQSGFSNQSSTILKNIEEVSIADLKDVTLFIIGSPTQGGQPKTSLRLFLNSIPQDSLRGIHIAAFDTRFLEKDLNFALKLLVRTIGYAAPKIADILGDKGGTPIAEPEGFIVKGKEGPLAPNELERAKLWGQLIEKRILQMHDEVK